MDKWEVFLVISALVGFLIAVVGPILKLNTTITKLIVTMENFETRFDKMDDSNSKSHGRIWNELEKHDEVLSDHETRLHDLERNDRGV